MHREQTKARTRQDALYVPLLGGSSGPPETTDATAPSETRAAVPVTNGPERPTRRAAGTDACDDCALPACFGCEHDPALNEPTLDQQIAVARSMECDLARVFRRCDEVFMATKAALKGAKGQRDKAEQDWRAQGRTLDALLDLVKL